MPQLPQAQLRAQRVAAILVVDGEAELVADADHAAVAGEDLGHQPLDALGAATSTRRLTISLPSPWPW